MEDGTSLPFQKIEEKMNIIADTVSSSTVSIDDIRIGPITFRTESFEFTADVLATFPSDCAVVAASVNNGLYFLVREEHAEADTAELVKRIQASDGNPLPLELETGIAYTGTLAGSGADVQFLAVFQP